MLISDQKRFIFVHIYKTGGSSITKLLGPYCEPQYRADTARLEGNGWQGTWHYLGRQHAKLCFLKFDPIWQKGNLGQHRICSIVRNPYSWALSVWNDFYRSEADAPAWFKGQYPSRTFLDFCRAMRSASTKSNESIWGSYSQLSFVSDPHLKADFIGRFERLETDVTRLLNFLDIPYSKMPHVIWNNPQERVEPMRFYNSEAVTIINDLFVDDFHAFDYKMVEP